MELLRLEEGEGSGSFRLIGELDSSTVTQVASRLQDELRGGELLTLDTSGLTFMDSQGVWMLIGLGMEATERGTSITLINCSRQVKRILEVAVPEGIPGVDILEADR
jgi:anti-anti-sigma factor